MMRRWMRKAANGFFHMLLEKGRMRVFLASLSAVSWSARIIFV